MKKRFIILILIWCGGNLFGQSSLVQVPGFIIYQTSQNIYAKFASTKGINLNDTIYGKNTQGIFPLFVVQYLSSVSCSGKPVGDVKVEISDPVVCFVSDKTDNDQVDKTQKKISNEEAGKLVQKEEPEFIHKQLINGRFSVISYQSYSNTSADDFQRMRYTLSFNGKNLANSAFSLESYLTFSHRLGDWASVQDHVFNGLKIYNLALNYEVRGKATLWLGRKINPKISSMGAIDGLQAEAGFNHFFAGAVVGFRPDYSDYSFNSSLLEYGAYAGYHYRTRTGSMHSTIAFMQQTNHGNVDRRFTYFQIDNSLVKDLNLFLSGEVDLYKLENGLPTTALTLTSLYFSLNYRLNRKLSVWASYDARKNVIYYETDKSYLDQLLEDATRQGVQLRLNYHPAKRWRLGVTGGYRNRNDDVKPVENANLYAAYDQVPWIKASATLSVNWMSNSYLSGFIYGLRMSKDIIPDKLYADVSFRFVDTKLTYLTTLQTQYIGEFDLQWNVTRKLSFSANYEGSVESADRFHRLYFSLIQRF